MHACMHHPGHVRYMTVINQRGRLRLHLVFLTLHVVDVEAGHSLGGTTSHHTLDEESELTP